LVGSRETAASGGSYLHSAAQVVFTSPATQDDRGHEDRHEGRDEGEGKRAGEGLLAPGVGPAGCIGVGGQAARKTAPE